jgi:hypothetical protein
MLKPRHGRNPTAPSGPPQQPDRRNRGCPTLDRATRILPRGKMRDGLVARSDGECEARAGPPARTGEDRPFAARCGMPLAPQSFIASCRKSSAAFHSGPAPPSCIAA